MKHRDPAVFLSRHFLPAALAAIIAAAGGLFGYAFFTMHELSDSIDALSTRLASTTAEAGKLSQDLATLRSQTSGLSSSLSSTQQSVSAVQNQVGGVEQTLGTVSTNVNTLQKLVTTDPELLKKYSKVYFLNENYTPAHLTAIPQAYVYSNTKPEQFLSEAWPFLKAMLDGAKADGITIYVASGYRSFGTQETLKSEYVVEYGAGTANAFSADQGYSEHQLGTAVDLITTGLDGELTDAFDGTEAFQWLTQNAYRYGFEMSYPQDNPYYVYEPWHWRFVGIKLATYLHANNLEFYNMDQRAIDAYLSDLFDNTPSS